MFMSWILEGSNIDNNVVHYKASKGVQDTGRFVCTQENKVTDKAMFVVFDKENEACLSDIGYARDM